MEKTCSSGIRICLSYWDLKGYWAISTGEYRNLLHPLLLRNPQVILLHQFTQLILHSTNGCFKTKSREDISPLIALMSQAWVSSPPEQLGMPGSLSKTNGGRAPTCVDHMRRKPSIVPFLMRIPISRTTSSYCELGEQHLTISTPQQ